VLLVTAKVRVAHEVDGEIVVTRILGCGELKLSLCLGGRGSERGSRGNGEENEKLCCISP
jgi:hypothetical protein